MRSKVMQWLVVALGAFALGTLGACSTVEGVGEDVESLGEGIQGAAEDATDG